ncbi:hypothetical protein DsansV1_C17g0144711 [Dioscorea sansibarensis]
MELKRKWGSKHSRSISPKCKLPHSVACTRWAPERWLHNPLLPPPPLPNPSEEGILKGQREKEDWPEYFCVHCTRRG